jgi:DNA primase
MEFVEQLKSSIDIIDVVGQYVRLRKAGTRWVGLCPFHTEKTPSFGVHSVHQFYKCFGCGAGGDAIKFVMEIEALTFYEALKLLSERYGVPMPKRAEYSDPETRLRAALYRMHELAAEAYRASLGGPAGSEARAYLAKRGVAPALAGEFALGLSDRSGQTLTRLFEREGFPPDQMEQSGLVSKRESGGFYDRFRGRLMFPIHNESGKVIAFGGRALAASDEPKYLNSPETPIYHKSLVLYNLHRAKPAMRAGSRAVLVEGYMDVIGVWSAGVKEVVASCGTSLTSQQVRAAKRHAERIVVNYDSDPAGANASEKYLQMLLDEGFQVRVLELEGGLDPDEYVKTHGAATYRACLEKAPGYFYWLADRARAKFDTRTAEGRISALKFLLPAVQRIADKLERATVANDVASYLGVEPGLVLDHFRKTATDRQQNKLPQASEGLRPVERILLAASMSEPEVRARILPRLRRSAQFQQFSTRRIFEALFAMLDSGAPFRFADLEARLAEADRELLSAVVFADKGDEEKTALEQAEACLESLEKTERATRVAELKTRIKQAERAGMLEEALRITEELSRLDRA